MAINIISRQIVLDVYKHDGTVPTINAIATDNDTRYVAAAIQNDGTRYDIGSSATVELLVLRSDGIGVGVAGEPHAFTEETPGSYNPETDEYTPGETITYYGVYAELDQAALAKTGTLLGQFKITSGNQVLHTGLFKINNGRALETETSDWTGEYQGYNLDELVQSVNTAVATVEGMESDVSDLKEAASHIASYGYVPIESGTYSDPDGANKITYNRRYRCVYPICTENISKITIPTGYSAWLYLYDGDMTYISIPNNKWQVNVIVPSNLSVYGDVKYIKLGIKKTATPDEDISGEIDTVRYSFLVESYNDSATDRNTGVINLLTEDYENVDLQVSATSAGWGLNKATGYSYANANYKILKYTVTAGDLLRITSDDVFQFQTSASVPGSGTLYVVGAPYGIYDGLIFVPSGATHLVVSTFTSGSTAKVARVNFDKKTGTIRTEIANARHVQNNSVSPLTFLHFSDIHADALALTRIINDANKYGSSIDEMICTGDMCLNTYGQINSWWNENVLTCIGNHDTASYSSNTYNWTALSMANRDAYYITPFKSNWGITHTSGKSYYYKDYSSAKVRLIVMDVMLYMASSTTDANAQTSWLTNLLSSAITNNLHVLIAIHSPHGGASPVDCSFTKYGQTTRPVYADANTPQSVIDAVASAISSGLHFIGYICGHSHVDTVWDADGDGKQLMYCITCANTSNSGMWDYTDLDRNGLDAYNLVTIDTAHTLVKIVRGGGADIDDHMRTRKAIGFDYSTGQKVGEVM